MSPVLTIQRNVPIPPLHPGPRLTFESRLKGYRTRTKQGWKFKREHGQRWITCEGCHEGHFVYFEPFIKNAPRPGIRSWLGNSEIVYPPYTRPRNPYCPKCMRTYLRAGGGMKIDEMPLTPMHTGREMRRTEPTGEQRLAAGLIASAVYDLHRDNEYHGGIQHREDVKRWLLGAPASMSYETCCDLLGLDPHWLRHALLHIPHNQHKHFRHVEGKVSGPHPVEEYVPDAGASERSSPARSLPSSWGAAPNGKSNKVV